MTFNPASYTVGEGDEEVVVMVMMVGNNTLVDVVVTFGTVDGTAIGTTSTYLLYYTKPHYQHPFHCIAMLGF